MSQLKIAYIFPGATKKMVCGFAVDPIGKNVLFLIITYFFKKVKCAEKATIFLNDLLGVIFVSCEAVLLSFRYQKRAN